jgi:hypothetical protein
MDEDRTGPGNAPPSQADLAVAVETNGRKETIA